MGAIIKIPGFRIYRSFVAAHPQFIFIYGQDYSNKGCLGQAWHVANEPNSFPAPTLYKVCNSQSDKYYFDEQFLSNKSKIDEKLDLIPLDGRPIIWLKKLGCGHSQLKFKAPITYEYLIKRLKDLEYKNIEWNYYE